MAVQGNQGFYREFRCFVWGISGFLNFRHSCLGGWGFWGCGVSLFGCRVLWGLGCYNAQSSASARGSSKDIPGSDHQALPRPLKTYLIPKAPCTHIVYT